MLLAYVLSFSPAVTPCATEVEVDVANMKKLDLVFGTQRSDYWQLRLKLAVSREQAYRDFVRDRLRDERLFPALMPRFWYVLAQNPKLIRFALKKGTTARRTFYYLDRPCAARDMVRVQPWWDLEQKVWICRDSYRPDVESDDAGQFCEATKPVGTADSSACGCGKLLLNCARDKAQEAEVVKAAIREPIDTAAYIVRNHRPFSEVLTGRATVRTAMGDFVYARQRYFRTGRFELAGGAQPRLLPRADEVSAGMLTTPLYLYWVNAPRLLWVGWAKDFMCVVDNSANVDAHEIFKTNDIGKLRATEQMHLAQQVGCRNCHARLEYGIRAYSGYPTAREGLRVMPERINPAGTRFVWSTPTDVRAEGVATPRFLAETAARQPEFAACTVQRVAELVYGGAPVPSDVEKHLSADFAVGEDWAHLLEEAVVARFVAGSRASAGQTSVSVDGPAR
jgi:hypothetical protein